MPIENVLVTPVTRHQCEAFRIESSEVRGNQALVERTGLVLDSMWRANLVSQHESCENYSQIRFVSRPT